MLEWALLKERYDFTCLRCRKREPEIALTQDHVVPRSLSGVDDISNIQPLCKRCNSKKGSRVIDYRQLWERQQVLAPSTPGGQTDEHPL